MEFVGKQEKQEIKPDPLARLCKLISIIDSFEFTRRAGGPTTLEDRNIFDMLIQRGSGEITFGLNDDQYDKLSKR